MKYLKFIIILITLSTAINAQSSRNYKFNFNASDTTKYFSLDLPENWKITTETFGTPYAIIGFEVSSSGTFQLNKCAPEMRMGIKILNLNLEESSELIGLSNKDSNIYLFKDVDDFVNIIAANKSKIQNTECMVFTINKITDCPTLKIKKSKKQKRKTTPKTYLLFSQNNKTVCIESFNNNFDEKTVSLLKATFKSN